MISTARKIQRQRAATGEGGFTLIELLIVIIVLGILAAIVVFALGGVTAQSASAACNTDAKSVSTAVSAYEAQNNGAVPATLGALTGTANGGPYLKTIPSSPYYLLSLDSAGNVLVSLAGGALTASPTIPLSQTGLGAITVQTAGSVLTVTGDTFTASANAPGTGWKTGGTVSPAVPAALITTTAEMYEGTGAFSWANTGSGNTGTVPATDLNQNICAGA